MQGQRIIFPQPLQARLEPFELDATPLGETELIARTVTSLISAGTEGANYGGKADMSGPTRYPVRPGYAATGEVLAAGKRSGFEPGQVIYMSTPHASVARFDTQQRVALLLPDGLEPEHAVFARLASVSMTTMRLTAARAGDRVAVIGLGLVGNLAAQNFQNAGMQVDAYDIEPGRRTIAEQCGIRTYDPHTATDEQANSYHLILEVTGSPEGAATAATLAQTGADIFLVGSPWISTTAIPVTALTQPIHLKYLVIRSGWEWSLPLHPTPHRPGALIQNGKLALDWIRDGKLTIEPLLSHILSPADAQTAYDGLIHQKDQYIGVVFDWRRLP